MLKKKIYTSQKMFCCRPLCKPNHYLSSSLSVRLVCPYVLVPVYVLFVCPQALASWRCLHTNFGFCLVNWIYGYFLNLFIFVMLLFRVSGLLLDIWKEKPHPWRWSLGYQFPGSIVNLGVIPGYTAVTSWMASDWHPGTKILTNRETANIGLGSSVGRAPAC